MAYTIQKGDTLSAIAAKNGTTVGAIAAANNIKDVNKIYAGASLNLPGSTSSSPTSSSTPGTNGALFGTGGVSTPTPTPTPKPGPVLPGYQSNDDRDSMSVLQNLSNQAKNIGTTAVDENAIRNDVLARYQAEIDATNRIYQDKLARAKVKGEGDIGTTRAINARSGLLGSDFGFANDSNVRTANEEIYSGIDNEKAASIASIMSTVKNKQAEEIAAKTAAKQKGAEDYIKYLSTSTERKQITLSKAVKAIIASGIDIKDMTSDQIKEIANNLGVSEADIKATYSDEKMAYDSAKSKAEKDEQAGKPASIQEYEYAKSQGYTGSFSQYQSEDANRKAQVLTPGQVNSTVNQIAGNFDNEPVVKEYNTIKTTINGLEKAGTSSTDDIQRIYAFAKIMDPNSAVREGEYKTVQEYSTALLQRLGINIERAFDARGFLTDQARENMKTTLNNVLVAKKSAYDSIKSEYQRQIDDAYAGKQRQITDYNATTSERKTVDGVQYEKVEGGWKKVSFNSEGSGSNNAGNRPQKNNNPLNIKSSTYTMNFPGVKGVDGVPATDGGKFLVFESPEAGFEAAKRLITSANYINLPVDSALRRWSGSGYGGEIVPAIKNKTISSLTQAELDALIKTMAKREGFYA